MQQEPQAPETRGGAPLASVIIATYNRGPTLIETINGILLNDYAATELVVVDQTREYTREVSDRLAELQAQHGYKHLRLSLPSLTLARNVGIQNSNGEVIIFCDDDVVVGRDFVRTHVRCYDNPYVGAVAGRVIGPGDEERIGTPAWTGKLHADGTFTANFHRGVSAEVDFGMGCNMSFRRSALIRAGCFDERYCGGFYREEGDTFARVKKLGYRVVFEAAASLEHLVAPGGGCRKDEYVPRMFSVFRNETLFFLNCMQYRFLPVFAYRLLRWMYATVKTNGYSFRELIYFAIAPLSGAKAHFLARPDQLSRDAAASRFVEHTPRVG
jgi:GT2 family glycosyltransferase